MALSEFYKGTDGKGWLAKAPQSLSAGDALLRLQQIDGVWERPPAIDSQPGRKSRQRRADGAGGGGGGAGARRRERGDDGTAATARRSEQTRSDRSRASLRRIASRFVVPPSGGNAQSRDVPPESGTTKFVIATLDHPDERARWGATRVFAQHFSYLTGNNEIADKLIARLSDPHTPVRMQAAKSLTQWFYWTKDESLRDRIADAFIARMAVNEHPWMRRNLIEGFTSWPTRTCATSTTTGSDTWRKRKTATGPSRATASRAAGWRSASPARSKQRRATARRAAARIDRVPPAPRRIHQRGPLHAHRQRHRDDSLLLRGRAGDGAPLTPLVNSPDAARRERAILAAYAARQHADRFAPRGDAPAQRPRAFGSRRLERVLSVAAAKSSSRTGVKRLRR